MAWVILFVAGLFECGWAIGLQLSDGFTRPVPSAFTAVALVVSFGLLAWALRSLPVGMARSGIWQCRVYVIDRSLVAIPFESVR